MVEFQIINVIVRLFSNRLVKDKFCIDDAIPGIFDSIVATGNSTTVMFWIMFSLQIPQLSMILREISWIPMGNESITKDDSVPL